MDPFNPYAAEQQDVQRKLALAQALQGQAFQPMQARQAGRFVVAPSPLEGIGKIAMALAAKNAGDQATDSGRQLGVKVAGERANALSKALAIGQGNETLIPPDPQEAMQSADYGTPQVGAAKTGSAGDPLAAYSMLARTGDPMLMQAGGQMLGFQQKQQEGEQNRQAKMMERIMALDAAATNAAASREERAARAAESAALRRELANQSDTTRRYVADQSAAAARQRDQDKQDAKKEVAFNQDIAMLNNMEGSMDRLSTAANEVMRHPGLEGIVGARGKIPNFPGSDAANAAAKLQTLKAQVGFGVLQEMRNASKSGGALGSVTEKELGFLQNALAALETTQDVDQFKESLQKIIDYSVGAKARLRNSFNLKHGESPYGRRSGDNAAPAVGAIQDGYRFKGGNPADPTSWEKAN